MEFHGLIPIDKPLGWTSHDVVGRIRRILLTKRVGHAGTLDPAATGVLIVGVGKATRFLDSIQQGAKQYVAHVVLGTETDSADIDGRIEPRSNTGVPTLRDIQSVLPRFVGDIIQVPPKYSAIKLDGEPLYRRVRRGEHVDVPARSVHIASLELVEFSYPDLLISIRCSAGTYIRSLARDIGDNLGCSAYLHHLLRTNVGAFDLASCWTLKELETHRFPESWSAIAINTDQALCCAEAVVAGSTQEASWYHGRSLPLSKIGKSKQLRCRVYGSSGTFIGAGEVLRQPNEETVKPKIVLAR